MKTRTKYLIVFLLGVIVGGAAEYGFLVHVWPHRYQSYSWVYALRNHRKPGEPCETDLVLDRQGYSLGYSYKHKSALWVSYVISSGSIGIDVDRGRSFYADPDIPERYRVEPEDHTRTGYDRGHLAPSAAIDFSLQANRETYALSNIIVQEGELNREAWHQLENYVREWTRTKGKLYVVTGPLYSSRPKKVNGLAIPSRFYKVIYSYDGDEAIGFIFPNKPVSHEEVWKYAMSVAEVERKTDLTFFSRFREKTQRELKESVDIGWWQKDL
ncbi:DNA/RNA non-specific endonuclease [candidate division KSB3 bacterium]|uniref:Endonuclease n=1 Tax=candidate division KSB3 bacterium TaxID=2044937 RepID=A0A9D5JUC0_9BACT|nr:DNA/RNA non-specific endonuclease [candidate division KSB3 bacterium]MBD3324305.1 DNA/RNA non-specific endonuclease [candidate division KSB3 bacterium]